MGKEGRHAGLCAKSKEMGRLGSDAQLVSRVFMRRREETANWRVPKMAHPPSIVRLGPPSHPYTGGSHLRGEVEEEGRGEWKVEETLGGNAGRWARVTGLWHSTQTTSDFRTDL